MIIFHQKVLINVLEWQFKLEIYSSLWLHVWNVCPCHSKLLEIFFQTRQQTTSLQHKDTRVFAKLLVWLLGGLALLGWCSGWQTYHSSASYFPTPCGLVWDMIQPYSCHGNTNFCSIILPKKSNLGLERPRLFCSWIRLQRCLGVNLCHRH